MPTSFRPGGYKITDGQTFRPLFTVEFGSRSNPSARPYTTIFWDDGDLSCNCRGWATHKNCRHCVALHEAALARGLTAYGVPAAVAQRASHLRDAFTEGHASAALVAGILHDGLTTVGELKSALAGWGVAVRPVDTSNARVSA